MTRDELYTAQAAYDAGEPVMTDAEFDALARTMPCPVIGEPGDTRHSLPMLSLDKASLADGAHDFGRFLAAVDCCGLLAQPKYDGVALALRYVRGKLAQALTRGDGYEGQDITRIVAGLPGIPQSAGVNFAFEVRGEVVISRKAYRAIGAPGANARSAVAGALRSHGAHPAKPYLRFVPHESRHGAEEIRDTQKLTACQAYYDRMTAARAAWWCDIDGVVFKATNEATRARLGETKRAPRWAVAVKFAPERATARIIRIDIRVGATGKRTPVAMITPVTLGGTRIEFVSLHSERVLDELGVREGDAVIVERTNDVIPAIVGRAGCQV